MFLRVVLLTGPPGVGKTVVGLRLVDLLAGRPVLIDIDALAQARPWDLSPAHRALAAANLRGVVANAVGIWHAETIVVTGLVAPEFLWPEIRADVAAAGIDLVVVALTASDEVLDWRIGTDPAYVNREIRQILRRTGREAADLPGAVVVDTDHENADAVAARVAGLVAGR